VKGGLEGWDIRCRVQPELRPITPQLGNEDFGREGKPSSSKTGNRKEISGKPSVHVISTDLIILLGEKAGKTNSQEPGIPLR
jgi:hypothetical protein